MPKPSSALFGRWRLIAALAMGVACSGPSVDPLGPGPEPTATIPIDAAPAVTADPRPVAPRDAAPQLAPDAAQAMVAQKPQPVSCSVEPAIYYVMGWPMADRASGQVTRQTVHDDGRWCYQGVGGSLAGELTSADLRAVRKLLAATTWSVVQSSMCDAVPSHYVEVTDVAKAQSLSYMVPCDLDPHASVSALIDGIGKRTTSTCTDTGDIVYEQTEVPLVTDDLDESLTTAITVWGAGRWRVDVGGKPVRAGCLNADQKRQLTRMIGKAAFVAAKAAETRCRAIPNVTVTITAGSRSFSYTAPCAEAPSATLAELMELVGELTRLR